MLDWESLGGPTEHHSRAMRRHSARRARETRFALVLARVVVALVGALVVIGALVAFVEERGR